MARLTEKSVYMEGSHIGVNKIPDVSSWTHNTSYNTGELTLFNKVSFEFGGVDTYHAA